MTPAEIQDSYQKSFQDGLEDLRQALSQTKFTMWFYDLNFIEYKEKKLVVSTANLIKKDKIEASYIPRLKTIFLRYFHGLEELEVLYQKSNKKTSMHFSDKSDVFAANTGPKQAGNSKSMQPGATFGNQAQGASVFNAKDGFRSKKPVDSLDPSAASTGKQNKEYSFDRFLVFKENKLAYDFTQKVMDNFGRISPLYIYGQVGVGKTHLLQATIQEVKQRYPFYKIRYITPDYFVGEFAMALRHKKDREFRIRYHSLDLLVVDDVQFFNGKEKSSIEFFHIFNAVYSPNKQMIIASDCEPQELSFFDERLKSRLSSSVIVEMQAPKELLSRKRLIMFYATSLKLSLNADILDYLLCNLPYDIRKIRGALRTLAMLLEIDAEATLDESYLKNYLYHWFKPSESVASKPLFIDPEKILQQVCQDFVVSKASLLSSKRSQKMARTRHMLIYLLRHAAKLSIAEIAEFLGGRTTSTVHHGLKKIERETLSDTELKQYLENFNVGKKTKASA